VISDQNTINITASGIAFASGSALVGEALLGPVGGVVGAILGLGAGVASEMLSPKNGNHSSEANNSASRKKSQSSS
jgi:hypothetical protein